MSTIFADMHDGDKKAVTISGDNGAIYSMQGRLMTIKPSGNSQKWTVNAKVYSSNCLANVDFNVPGKPNPPPVRLLATLFRSTSATGRKTVLEFTDPTGKLAARRDFPLNVWVQIGKDDLSVALPLIM